MKDGLQKINRFIRQKLGRLGWGSNARDGGDSYELSGMVSSDRLERLDTVLRDLEPVFDSVQEKRRRMLKYFAIGGGAFVAGKILGPSISLFSGVGVGQEFNFRNFRVVETGKELRFYDHLGNSILTLDKDADTT